MKSPQETKESQSEPTTIFLKPKDIVHDFEPLAVACGGQQFPKEKSLALAVAHKK